MSELDSEVETKARIKANARLTPAKDIHVAFTEIASSADPEAFEDLRSSLVLAIDSASEEYKILAREVNVIKTACVAWEHETEACAEDIRRLESQLVANQEEKEVIDQEISRLSNLESIKRELARADLPGVDQKIAELGKGNAELIREIEKTDRSNEHRRGGMDQIKEAFRIFLLQDTRDDDE